MVQTVYDPKSRSFIYDIPGPFDHHFTVSVIVETLNNDDSTTPARKFSTGSEWYGDAHRGIIEINVDTGSFPHIFFLSQIQCMYIRVFVWSDYFENSFPSHYSTLNEIQE